MILTWRLAHPASPHLWGWDGPTLVAQVVRFDAPPPAHWVGHVRNEPVTGRLVTAEEAMAAVEEKLSRIS